MRVPKGFRAFRVFAEMWVRKGIPAVKVPRGMWVLRVLPVRPVLPGLWGRKEISALKDPEAFRVP